uniref:(northern house mosquito) hypothetical protein n=1 Tax=Culex pipiens TaxID=7175 RepID=A0A8D8GK24_CULPI
MPSCSAVRPVGQKRAKIDSAQSENLHITLREIADNGKRLIELSEMKFQDSKTRTDSLKKMVYHKIMSVDYAKLSPTAQIFYNQQQKLILEQCEREQKEREQLPVFGDEQNDNLSSTNAEGDYAVDFDVTENRATSSRIVRIETVDLFSNQSLVLPETQEDLDALNISYSPERSSEG